MIAGDWFGWSFRYSDIGSFDVWFVFTVLLATRLVTTRKYPVSLQDQGSVIRIGYTPKAALCDTMKSWI